MDSGNITESLDDYMHPSKMRDIIAGVKNLCGFDEYTKLFETPSLAKKNLYTVLKHAQQLDTARAI